MAQKLANWFVSQTGRKVMSIVAGGTTFTICATYALPNTLLLHKYEDVVHLYKYGTKEKLTSKVLDRVDRALDLLEVPEHERKLIKPFQIFGFDLFNAGTLYSKFGGLLGIPKNFSFIDQESLDKNEIMVLNEPVNWSTTEGQDLLESLLLTESAQIFAIAREVLYLKSLKILFDTIYASATFIFTYGLAQKLNTKYDLYTKPFSLRFCMYGLVGIFGLGMYSFCTDFTQVQYDQYVDKELCKKNPLFVEAGKEFYDKTMQRNRALRSLMGPLGEKYYSVLGNERFLIRQRRLPLLTRRDFYENKLRELTA